MAFPIAARFAHPGNGYKGDQEQCAKYLTPGKVYTLTGLDVGRTSSRLFLDIPDAPAFGFNTVMFEPASVYDVDGAIGPDDEPEPKPEPFKRPHGCVCVMFRDTGRFRIADLTCPVHGVGATDPGDGQWEGNDDAEG
jgi:hypothetical protein